MYCRECGTENKESAAFCINCSAPLKPQAVAKKVQDECFGPAQEDRMRQAGDVCFVLPYGGAILGAFFGFLVILFGFSLIYRVNFWTWILPYVSIVVGSLIVLVTVIGVYRYRQFSK